MVSDKMIHMAFRTRTTLFTKPIREIFHFLYLPKLYIGFNSLFATFADLHVRKRATFAALHSYTHAYCSFVLLNDAITTVFGSHCLHALLIWLFRILQTIYR